MPETLLTQAGSEEKQLTVEASETNLMRPVVRFAEAVNCGDLDTAIRQLEPKSIHYARVSHYTPEGVRLLFNIFRTVLPDLRLDLQDIRVEGNRVISRVVGSGTHTGSYLGKPPTGQPVLWETLDIAEVNLASETAEVVSAEDDEADLWRISRRHWDLWNDPNLWKDLGFIPEVMC